MTADYAQLLRVLLPETALLVGALLVLLLDLAIFRDRAASTRVAIATATGALACAVAVVLACNSGAVGEVFGGVLMIDRLAVAARIGVAVLTILALAGGFGARMPQPGVEYVAIMLFAALGLSLMAAAQQFLLVFVALELASLSLYILVGFDRSQPAAAEAAVKYFLFGGMSAAFLLFGFSLLYGLTGSINLGEVSRVLNERGFSPLLAVAVVMLVVAFGFKSAAVPFHLWAPDAYQGAPAPSAAFIASASKLAGAVLFLRLFWAGAVGEANPAESLGGGIWMPVVAGAAALSLLLGNLVALAQSNLRRLLAYSAIAHAGVVLLGVLVARPPDVAGPVFYYVATYGLATVGAFGVIGIAERAGVGQDLRDLAGLRQRSPFLALCLFVFVLSLAGIPPLAGFLGKFFVFAAALEQGGPDTVVGALAIAAILFSAVGLYYYLIILKHAIVTRPAAEVTAIRVPFAAAVALALAALAVLLLGLWPSLIFAPLAGG